MKTLPLILVTVLAFGCSRETTYPYHHATGTLTVEGTDYHSALIIQHKSDGIHVVGGFVSDSPLGAITIGPNNSQKTPLQIIPSQSIIVYNGKRQTIADNGRLIWFVGGKTYDQALVGFPLEEDLKRPEEITNKTGAELKLSPVHPDEDVEYTLNQRFGMDYAMGSLDSVRSFLASFRKLTEESKGKIPDNKLKEIGNTDWDIQNLGFHNNPNSIEGTLRKQDYLLKKLEFELAKTRKELGQCPDSEIKIKRDAYEKSEKEFQAFWNGFGIAD